MSQAEGGGPYASVAVPVPVRRLFTYSVGGGLAGGLVAGDRVRVPFGPRQVVGTVVEWPAPPPGDDVPVRPIGGLAPDGRRLPPALLELTRFVADYYLCSWGEAIEAALPGAPPAPVRAARRLPGADPEALPARAKAQRRALAALPADGRPWPVSRLDAGAQRALAALERDGRVERLELRPPARPPSPPSPPSGAAPPEPTPGQAAVLAELSPALDGGGYAPFLLFGETGSGKTEVYFRAAERTLAAGRSVLYLVPEIGLTPLLMNKILLRFGEQVSLLHSGLGGRRRAEEWERIRTGGSRLVVGTRSAVFAPLAGLGLVVVDEEQDGSYKQEETPRYNGRDVAVFRASREGAALLLGSATPSMESFRHARAGRYRLLRLGGRILQRPLPEVRRVDMRLEFQRRGAVTPLSAPLIHALRGTVARGEQALVLRNRRGWAAAVLCPVCGERVGCGACSLSMTWHRAQRRLRCHACDASQGWPERCPTCGATELKLLGEGTEQIEDLVRAAVPGAVVERMDRDAIRGRGAHERLLRRFDAGEIAILVGTQMIAKGHDFPRVTLVGVLSADQALGIPDFRAAERAFQLLTQVAGRAGRGERPGIVVVQAFAPDHPVLHQAEAQDYEAFYEREIRYRRALRYPPLAALVRLVVQDRREDRARGWAERLAEAVLAAGEGRLMLTGPGPAPIERLRGRWRHQLLVRSAGRRRLVAAVDEALRRVEGQVPRRAIVVDVDPYTLM